MTFQCNNKIAQRTARAFCAVPPATSHVRSAHIAAAVGATFTTLRPFIPVPLAACGKARLECRLTKETAYAPARVSHAGSHRAPGGVWPTLCFVYLTCVPFGKISWLDLACFCGSLCLSESLCRLQRASKDVGRLSHPSHHPRAIVELYSHQCCQTRAYKAFELCCGTSPSTVSSEEEKYERGL